MRAFLRLTFGLAIGACVAVAALGLYNLRRGEPVLSMAGVAEWPVSAGRELREALDPDYARRLGRSNATSDAVNGRLQALRAAIGCEGPSDGAGLGERRWAYQWRDANGVQNLADEAPANGMATTLPLATDAEFSISVNVADAVLPTEFEGQLRAGAKRTYDYWREWLGDDAVVRSRINLHFLGDAGHFANVYGRADGEGWRTTGFYRIRSNEAMILYTPEVRGSALATAFHEMSHLITAWQLGPTPPWLNEGIAEHFEIMQLSWRPTALPLNARHLAVLRRDGIIPIDELTKLSRRDWSAEQPERRYASAWAVIAYLLHSPEGQLTLQSVLRTAHANRCSTPADLQAALNEGYQGGLAQLQVDLTRWLGQRFAQVAIQRP